MIATAMIVSALSARAAQPIQLTLDPAHTTIAWTLSATMHTVHGTFQLKSGQISFDPATGAVNGELVVDATSGQSGNHLRDEKMHKDVLESRRYPEITFMPKAIVGKIAAQGNSTLQIQGTFHIHGADHDLTLEVPLDITGNEVKANTVLTVPYAAWGMKNPGPFFLHVDDKVQLTVAVVGRLTRPGAAR